MNLTANHTPSSLKALKWATGVAVTVLVAATAAYGYFSYWVSRMTPPLGSGHGTRESYSAASQFRLSILETYPYYQTYALTGMIVGTCATMLLGLMLRDRLRKARMAT